MPLRRAISIERERAKAEESGDLVVGMAFSSEIPASRWWGNEILDHTDKSIRMTRLNDGAAVLFNHNPNEIRGVHVAGSIRVEDRVLRGDVRLTSATQAGRDAIAMVQGGILTKASVGYRAYKVIQQTKQRDGETLTRELDGDLFHRMIEQAEADPKRDRSAFYRLLDTHGGANPASGQRKADEPDTFRIVDWEPFENSLVTVPVDASVGVGRSESQSPEPTLSNRSEIMTTQVIENDPQRALALAEAGAGATEESILKIMRDRDVAVRQFAQSAGIEEQAIQLWIRNGTPWKTISDHILKVIEERGKNNPRTITNLDLSAQEKKRFSLSRAILACATDTWKGAEFEAECSQEIAGRLGRGTNPHEHRLFVPQDIQERAIMTPTEHMLYALAKRDLTVANAAQAGYLVSTSNMGFIELLRNMSVLLNMGARRLGGLQGNITIPKQTGAGTAVWMSSESATITESMQTFAQIALTPKTVGGYTEISRQLLLQSSPEAEGLVMSDLAQVVSLAIDLAGLNGSGAAGQPTGILQTSGIGSVTGTTLDYADIVEFQTDVFAGNALSEGAGYVTTGAVAGLLKSRVKFTGTASPIWDGRLELANVDGYKGMASNQMPAATMLFGVFSEVLLAEWGVLELEINPYAVFQSGIVGVRAIQSVDIAVRYATAFAAASSIT